MEGKIAVSVMCLAYNHEKYIRNALEGFVHQKADFRYEVLIHDDASTDGTANIIREYEERYPDLIRPVYQKENQYSRGVDIFYNYLNPMARGRYFCYCEGDDYWCDEYKLQKQFDVMENCPECSICVCKVACVNEDGSSDARIIPEERYHISAGKQSEDDMVRAFWKEDGYPFQTSGYFIRKEVDTYYYEHTDVFRSFHGDIGTLRAAFCFGSVYYIDEIMSVYRQSSIGGWTGRYGASDIHKKIDYWKRMINGELQFNEFTNGKYEDDILGMCAENILGWCMYEPKAAQKLITDAGISWKQVCQMDSGKLKIYYLMLEYFPASFKLLRIVKKLLKATD